MILRVNVLLGAALCLLSGPGAFSLALSATTPSLQDISIQDLNDLLDSGVITSYDLTQTYLRRIGQVNGKLNAVIEVSSQALAVARQRDRERAQGLKLGPLHGIPILVKDNYATVDDTATGAGSTCLAKLRPSKEATVVARLRKAGAIILGKANLSEFSGGRGRFSEGWSARGNQTTGAYVEHQSACGSSSGSGVAASLGLAAAALGTETSGSITCPAFYNNVVGIKPTMGLTSRFGVVPLIVRQDTTGPLAQTVADAALVLDVIAGKDSNDNYTLIQPPRAPMSFSAALNASALQGKRIGVAFNEDNVLNDTAIGAGLKHAKKAFDAALGDLEKAGAELVKVDIGIPGVPLRDSIMRLGGNIGNYTWPDFADGLTKYMQSCVPDGSAPRTIDELVECMEKDPKESDGDVDMSSIKRLAQVNVTNDSLEVWEAYKEAVRISRELLLSPIEAHGLDGMVMFMDLALLLAAAPGLPIVTVPMGALGPDAPTVWNDFGKAIAVAPGLPAGLSFVGDQWSEHELVGYAYAYEQVSKKRATLTPYLKVEADLESILGRPMVDDMYLQF